MMDNQAVIGTKRQWWRVFVQPQVLDRFEQLVILVLWAWMCSRVISAIELHQTTPWALLVLVAETTVLIFTLIRRPTDRISLSWRDWFLAFSGTVLPTLVQTSQSPNTAMIVIAVVLLTVGNCLQAMAKLFLRRSFGIAPANRGIKMDGPYRLVRHPMYAGYALTHIGTMIMFPLWINLVIYTTAWTAQIMRLVAEERLLGRDSAYQEYMQKVRWRLIPGVF